MAHADIGNDELAKAVDVNPVTVSNWRSGSFIPDERRLLRIARALKVSAAWLRDGTEGAAATPPSASVVRETPSSNYVPGWPEGWQARTYRLALEASEKGATEEEIAVVRGWMMDPQLQLLWSGGAPADDRMKE